jgi:hypothetical protein
MKISVCCVLALLFASTGLSAETDPEVQARIDEIHRQLERDRAANNKAHEMYCPYPYVMAASTHFVPKQPTAPMPTLTPANNHQLAVQPAPVAPQPVQSRPSVRERLKKLFRR